MRTRANERPRAADRPAGLPEVERGRLTLDRCVSARVLHDGPLVQVVRWRCHHDGEALRAERRHTDVVLSLVTSGASALHDGSWSVTVDPTTAVVYKPGAGYRTSHPFGALDAGWNVVYRGAGALELLDRAGVGPADWRPPSLVVATRPARALLDRFLLFERLSRARRVDPLAVEETCLDLLAELVAPAARRPRPRDGGRPTPAQRRVVSRAIDYVNLGFREPIRLADVGRAAGASPFHLSRLFRAFTGLSVAGYVRRLRLAGALDLVLADERPLTDIALDHGYSSHSHLTAVFSEQLGRPPRDVRRSLHAPETPRAGTIRARF